MFTSMPTENKEMIRAAASREYIMLITHDTK